MDEQISSLKRDPVSPAAGAAPSASAGETGTEDDDIAPLGLKGASFRWNSTELAKSTSAPPSESGDNGKAGKQPERLLTTDSVTQGSEIETASVASTDVEAVRFELRDITVTFPQGKLSVVTGPTASGKTALMVHFSSQLSDGRS